MQVRKERLFKTMLQISLHCVRILSERQKIARDSFIAENCYDNIIHRSKYVLVWSVYTGNFDDFNGNFYFCYICLLFLRYGTKWHLYYDNRLPNICGTYFDQANNERWNDKFLLWQIQLAANYMDWQFQFSNFVIRRLLY